MSSAPEIEPAQIDGLVGLPGKADLDLLSDFLGLFEMETQQSFERMRAATPETVVAVIGSEAHSLAGSSANLGLARLASTCRMLSDAVKTGDCNACFRADAIALLGKEYHAGLSALKNHYGISE